MTTSNRPLLRVENLHKHFPVEGGVTQGWRAKQRVVRAVDGVDLEIPEGQTLAVVGESGSGKSTLGRLLIRLLAPTSGRILYKGTDIVTMGRGALRDFRRHAQIIFQDPYSSLNPRMRVGAIVREPLDVYGDGTKTQREKRVHELLERVGLTPAHARSYPSELSGGQRQRVGIAAALSLSPALIIADEPTSALDVSVQAQTLNLLAELQRDYNLTFVFITHDLGVVQHFSDRVAVMYLGKIVEQAPSSALFENPQHPYTKLLISAIPVPDPKQRAELQVPDGDPPSPMDPPTGCRFHPRCPQVMTHCSQQHPPLTQTGPDHQVSCLLYREAS